MQAPPSAAARSWADVPVLGQILDLLQDPRDLAACACVCRSWRGEAQWHERWQGMWGREVSPQGLWRWSRADGGFREQLRARSLLRKGAQTPQPAIFRRSLVRLVLSCLVLQPLTQ